MKNRRYKKARLCASYVICIFYCISACFGQTFTIAAAPSSLTIYPGQQASVTITAGSSTYTGPINVTLTGLPSGITISSLTLTAGSSGTLTLNASLSAGQEGFSSAVLIGAPTSWTAPVTVVGAAGSTQATSQLSLTVSISNPSFAPASSAINLPIVNINTNGVAVVSKTTDVPGTITISSADGQTSYLPNASDSDNTATFHVHGNSTADMPKLPYHVSLTTSVDLLNTMGLQCPYVTDTKGKPTCDKSKSYVLIANYDDKTALRTWAAGVLANSIPIGNEYLNSPADSPTPSGTSVLTPWAPHSLFVELYLNGMYEGNYLLIEEIKVDTHRVNIDELTETDTAPANVTGGYLMEIDYREEEDYIFNTPLGLPIGLIDPDFSPDPEVPEQTSYISSYVGAAETALFASNFTDPNLGWRAYFDEASAINFYIVQDIMGNVDGGSFNDSDYLYKNDNNPLIYMGPVWDFDESAGNVNYQPIVSPVVPWMQTQAIWYAQWFSDPGFRADVVTQWNALKKNGVFATWLTSIRQKAESLEQSQVNNFGRWPMQGIQTWPNAEAAGSYAGEVQYLINWLNLRIAYLDSLFNNKAVTSTTLGAASGSLRNGSPVALTAQVSGGSTPTGVVSFLSNGVLLGTGSLIGGAANLTLSNLPVGMAGLQAIYNGDNANALSSSATQAVTVAAPLASTVTSIAGSLSAFSASVVGSSGTAIPTGTVTFYLDLDPGTTVTLNGAGQTNYSPSKLPPGTHALIASYSGDANYSASSSTPIIFQTSLIRPPFRR